MCNQGDDKTSTIFCVHFHAAVSSPGDDSVEQREAKQWREQLGLLSTPCHGTGNGAKLSWLHPAAFLHQASETAMGPFFLMTFKKQVTFIIFRYTALGGMGRDKKLYQLVATFPHACLELALAVSPPSHLVCCRKRIFVGANAQAAASGQLCAFAGAAPCLTQVGCRAAALFH